MTDFKTSTEAAWRRVVRAAIRNADKGDLTKTEKDLTIAIVNLWFHHRNGPRGYIHPSKKVLAKKAKCSVRTVATCLTKLRNVGALRPVSHMRGGKGFSTRYKVNLRSLFTFCGCDYPDEIAINCTLTELKIAHLGYAKIAHCISNVPSYEKKNPNQDIETPGCEHE